MIHDLAHSKGWFGILFAKTEYFMLLFCSAVDERLTHVKIFCHQQPSETVVAVVFVVVAAPSAAAEWKTLLHSSDASVTIFDRRHKAATSSAAVSANLLVFAINNIKR